jgi:hypothetical protein
MVQHTYIPRLKRFVDRPTKIPPAGATVTKDAYPVKQSCHRLARDIRIAEQNTGTDKI